MLSAALELADAGLEVFPVCRGGADGGKPKAPACAHGFKDATTDPHQISRWFSSGAVGVAIRTGYYEAVGMYLVVIDADRPKREGDVDGVEWLERWQSGEIDGVEHKLPKTLEAVSCSGGTHLYYWSDKEWRCTATDDPNIDARCEGGGIVASPTSIVRPDGTSGAYAWVGGRFDPSLIAEANGEVKALLDLVSPKRRRKAAAVSVSVVKAGRI